MNRKFMGFTASVLVVSVLLGGINISAKSQPKTTLKTKKVTMQERTKKSVPLKNKKKNATYTYKSSNVKVAKVSKSGKITALKSGKANISVTEKIKGKKKKKIGTLTVTVKAAAKSTSQQTATPATSTAPLVQPSQSPTATPPAASLTPSGPSASPAISTPEPEPPLPEPEITTQTPPKLAMEDDNVTYGTLKKDTYYSSTTGKNRNVNIILPAGYTEDKKYPVLYLFHGGMGDENDWLSGSIVNTIGNMISWEEAEEMILVLPNCRCRENDAANPSDGLAPEHVQSFDRFLTDFEDNLMPYMEQNYSVATGRENTAIAGFSMGGRTALNIGFHLYDKIKYIGAFTPAYGIFEYENMGLHEDGLFTEETFTLPDEYKNNTFLMMNKGNQDNMVNDEPIRYHEALLKNGVPHTYYTMDGGHDWPLWRNGFYNFARYIFQ